MIEIQCCGWKMDGQWLSSHMGLLVIGQSRVVAEVSHGEFASRGEGEWFRWHGWAARGIAR